jgi:hypothetical protein
MSGYTTFRQSTSRERLNNIRNVLEAVDQTVREVICWVDLPLVSCPMVRSEKNAICDQVPHLWVWVIEVLLHAEDSFSRPVLPEFHVLEL